MRTNLLELAKFSQDGIELPDASRSLTYLYGLSDFWLYMFNDEELMAGYLGTQTYLMSEVYNEFLQQASGISLNTVQEHFNYQIRLELLTVPTGASLATQNVFALPEELKSARFLCNTPLFPTVILESGVDFHIDQAANTVTFARPLSSYNFGLQSNTTGTYFGVWAVDARVDQKALADYALLVGQTLSNPTLTYKSFLQGIYYLYINGPTLALLVRGLNLSLGIPLARDSETVLATVQDNVTNNWTVVTTLNSYELPYGLPPSVTVGQELTAFATLANWIQVEDELSQDGWWLNLQIPSNLLLTLPAGESRYATTGSYADWVMRNYLARHTFLVNINTTNFENVQQFSSVIELLQTAKPKYTATIYIWSVPVTETLIATDTSTDQIQWSICEDLATDVDNFRRDSKSPLTRGGCAKMTRFSFPSRYQHSFAAVQNSTGTVTNSVPALDFSYDNSGTVTRMNFGLANIPTVEETIVGIGTGGALAATLPSNVTSPLVVTREDVLGKVQLSSASRTNYLYYSTDFTNIGGWNPVNATAAAYPSATDPLGGNSAYELTNLVTGGDCYLANLHDSPIYHQAVYSCFVSQGGASPATAVTMRNILWYNGTSSLDDIELSYDFTTKTFSGSTGNYVAYGAIDLGDGWYRLWCIPMIVPGIDLQEFRVKPGGLSAVAGETALFWGPQLEDYTGLNTPSAYIATTTSSVNYTDYTVSGTTLNVAYANQGAEIKVETTVTAATPRRTWNEIPDSTNYSIGWTTTNATFNAGTAPDGSNTAVYVNVPAGMSSWSVPQFQSIYRLPVGKTYTYSCFYKASATNSIVVPAIGTTGGQDVRTAFDLSNGTYVLQGPGQTPSSFGISYAGDGWYRIWYTFVSAGPSLLFLLGGAGTFDVGGWTGTTTQDISYWAWGPQLEEGVEPTQYSPTTGSFVAGPDRLRPEAAWAAALFTRGVGQYLCPRSAMSWTRGISSTPVTVNTLPLVPNGYRGIYLYTVSSWALSLKLAQLGGLRLPADGTWFFTLVDGTIPNTMEINEYAINASSGSGTGLGLYTNNFDLLFKPAPNESLPKYFGPQAYQSYAPDVANLVVGDFLLFVQSTNEAWGCFWVTSSMDQGWANQAVASTDALTLTQTGYPSRSGAPNTAAPFYFTRGIGGASNSQPVAPMNAAPIDATLPTSGTSSSVNYTDYTNTNVTLNRQVTLTENATL